VNPGNSYLHALIDKLPTEKTASRGRNLTIGSNPSYTSLPYSPSVFNSDSDLESDGDGYVNDGTILDLKKLMPLPQEFAGVKVGK